MTRASSPSLDESAARPWDVVVIGAGPAGSLAARELARLGRSVLLVDAASFPRAKVCGCCLNGRALTALARAGLAELPARLGAVPLSRFRLAVSGRVAELPLPAGVALSREAFDFGLIESAIASGVNFLPATRAWLDGECEGDRRSVRLVQGEQTRSVRTRVVLAADGLGGGLLARSGVAPLVRAGSRIGAGAIFPSAESTFGPGTIYMASGSGGYVGLVRVEDGRLDVAAALDPDAVRSAGGLVELISSILREAGWPAPRGLESAAWRGTPALTRRIGSVAHPRLFVLGDAAGYVEPFTGEGMAWAMQSALAVAPIAADAVAAWKPRHASAWRRRHRSIVQQRQLICRLSAAVLRRPWLVSLGSAVLAAVPALAAPVIGLLNRYRPLLREIP